MKFQTLQAPSRPLDRSDDRPPVVSRPERKEVIVDPSVEPVRTDKTSSYRGGSRSHQNLLWFSRQLYLLVSTGTPLASALRSISDRARETRWRGTLRDLCERIERGSSFSEALAEHPRHFDAVFCSLIAAGEASGQMPQMLERLASLISQQIRLRKAVVGALIYPALLLSAALSALGAMIVVVLPRFSDLFASMQVPLPPTTAMLIDFGGFARQNWLVLVIVAVAVALAGFGATRMSSVRRILDGLVLRLPLFGKVFKSFATARIARLLGTLIAARVSLLEALCLVRRSMRSTVYAEMLEGAEETIAQGEPLSVAFAAPKLIDPIVHEAVRSGEDGGEVGHLLIEIAEFLDDENQSTIRTLTTLLEPIILILLGLIVGFIAVSLFLPLFDITANAQGGVQ